MAKYRVGLRMKSKMLSITIQNQSIAGNVGNTKIRMQPVANARVVLIIYPYNDVN